MVLKVVESALMCHRCKAETPHELTYIGDHLAEAVCLGCREASRRLPAPVFLDGG